MQAGTPAEENLSSSRWRGRHLRFGAKPEGADDYSPPLAQRLTRLASPLITGAPLPIYQFERSELAGFGKYSLMMHRGLTQLLTSDRRAAILRCGPGSAARPITPAASENHDTVRSVGCRRLGPWLCDSKSLQSRKSGLHILFCDEDRSPTSVMAFQLNRRCSPPGTRPRRPNLTQSGRRAPGFFPLRRPAGPRALHLMYSVMQNCLG
jgi:hypothetical protein